MATKDPKRGLRKKGLLFVIHHQFYHLLQTERYGVAETHDHAVSQNGAGWAVFTALRGSFSYGFTLR